MKIVLSRKGFDSSAGGVASAIAPGGELVSLPIPDPQSPQRYRQLRGARPSVANWVSQLSGGRVAPGDGVHLDPDLARHSLPRQPGWRAGFGQAGSALGHLDAHGVGVGDLFLFFGWFRAVERHGGRWRHQPGAPDLHVLFGWLSVGEVWRAPQPLPESQRQHVHARRDFRGDNAIYIAAERCRLGGSALPGHGLWQSLHPDLVLTDGASRSQWRLPAWFHPGGRHSCLSYHQRPDRWQRDGEHCRLRAVARGQEFVLDTDHYPEALDWAAGLIQLSP